MEKLTQEYILRLAFIDSVDREELLLKKYDEYRSNIKDNELNKTLKDFKNLSRKHIEALKDRMMKLNFEK